MSLGKDLVGRVDTLEEEVFIKTKAIARYRKYYTVTHNVWREATKPAEPVSSAVASAEVV